MRDKVLDEIGEEFILVIGPFPVAPVILEQVNALIFKEDFFFVREKSCEKLPIIVTLNQIKYTSSSMAFL